MTTLFETVSVCPRCGVVFLGQQIGSCGASGHDTDFFPHFWGAFPLPLFVTRCPECGLAASSGEFEPARGSGQGPSEIIVIPSHLATQCPRDPGDSGADRYADAAAHQRAKGAKEHELAQLYLRAGWCARFEDGRGGGRETPMLVAAADCFAAAQREGQVPRRERARTAYLTGELYRRAGAFEAALSWFARAQQERVPRDLRDLLPVAIGEQSGRAAERDAAPTCFGPGGIEVQPVLPGHERLPYDARSAKPANGTVGNHEHTTGATSQPGKPGTEAPPCLNRDIGSGRNPQTRTASMAWATFEMRQRGASSRRVVLAAGSCATIGRGPDVDLAVPDASVSREHCRITYDPPHLVVDDLGSTNGTFVGWRRVQHHILKMRDEVCIGDPKTVTRVTSFIAPPGAGHDHDVP